MPEKTNFQLNVPNVLKAIDYAKDDLSISRNYNMLLCMFISPVLFIASFLNSIICIFLFHENVSITLLNSFVFLTFAICFEVLLRTKLSIKIETHLISILYCIVFIFSAVKFYDDIGPAIWTFGFIQVALALAHICKVMLTYTSITMLATGIYVTLFKIPNFSDNPIYPILQFASFVLLFIISFTIFNMNVSRIKKIRKNIEEINKHVTDRKNTEKDNMRLALYDHLTGLPNRTYFYDLLNQSLQLSKHKGNKIYLLFVDLDLFKMVNDSMGHSSGDELLKMVSQRLVNEFSGNDVLARIGGDEFLIMLRDVHNNQQVTKVANNILQIMNKPFVLNMRQLHVTCSIGISKYPNDGEDVDTLIKQADLAMYKAKEDGKNRFAFYSENLGKYVQHEMDMINAMQEGLMHSEFELYYQPQVNEETTEIIGLEALIRWNHPTLGLLYPNDFLATAEKTGLIVPIGEWVILTACKQNMLWQKEGIVKVPIAVNLSPNQISSSLSSYISEVLKVTGMDPSFLELEITENILFNDIIKIKDGLNEIKKLGIKITVDDFGSGYSSISYLKDFPIDRIKIPMEFVHGIDQNIKDESIITVILTLADNLNLEVVAEGVETQGQLDFLKGRLCSKIQGYYFSRPMKSMDIEGFCRRKIC